MAPRQVGRWIIVESDMRCVWVIVIGTIAVLASSASAGAEDAGLLKQAQEVFQPLLKNISGPGPGATEEQIALGRSLFFDPRITVDGNVSCATCHQPALYGTDGLSTSIGVKHRPHPRNAPTVLNSGVNTIVHWRGDRESLEDQAIKALGSPITNGQPDIGAALDRLKRIPGYAPLFEAAFPGDAATLNVGNVANAISAYERTLVTPAPFDVYLAGHVDALSPGARSGLETFINIGCSACHSGVGIGGSTYHKFGVVEDYWAVTGSQTVDKGRADVTNDPADLYVFRVPSLRNVAMTAPYFHDGSIATLPEAVRVMARVQLGLKPSDHEVNDIVSFLQSLTGELPAEFATAPVLPPGAISAQP
jgi:cytochrome c peroxidase